MGTETAVKDGDTGSDDEILLTELEKFEVDRIDGVGAAANGFGILMLKGLAKADAENHGPFDGTHKHRHPAFDGPDSDGDGVHGHEHSHSGDADHHHAHGSAGKSATELAVKAVVRGKVDEGPDVDLGKQIMALLGQAIGNEAQEIAAGFHGEICDVTMLTQAAELVKCWTQGEQTAPIDGASVKGTWSYAADDVEKAAREFTEAERKKHASEGNALPDGSYPVPDKDALRRAAILARSKHGNWQAAERLIARRARELGVPDPLHDSDGDAGKSAIAEGDTPVDTVTQEFIQAEIAKALQPHKEREQTLGAELAKAVAKADAAEALVKEWSAKPVPGGPVLSSNARPPHAEDVTRKAALIADAEEAERLAATVADPGDSAAYSQIAARKREEAAKA